MPTAPLKFTVYKFIAPYKQSYCKTMGGTGVTGCLEYAYRDFKIGDTVVSMGGNGVVSDGTHPPFVNGQLYGSGANGGSGSIPLSVLNKVATDIEASQLNTYTNNVSQSNPTNGNTASKSFFTPKNVIIGIVAIAVIFGGLKLAKVF